MIKRNLIYLGVYFLWIMNIFFFPIDNDYYQSLTLPLFSPSKFFIILCSLIIYFLITITILDIIKKYKINNNYIFIMAINYIFNQVYFLFFFIFNSLLFMSISIIIATITSILLYYETKKMNQKTAYYLIPYLLWNIYLTIISIAIFILNR